MCAKRWLKQAKENTFARGESLITKIQQLELLVSIRDATIKQLQDEKLQMSHTIHFQENKIKKLNTELAKTKEKMNDSDLLSSPQLIKQ
ncbi:unnamed protein product [Rotaria sp. Silwood2]|nr:unnamed protein product [Rotaria sp. Silwood2]